MSKNLILEYIKCRTDDNDYKDITTTFIADKFDLSRNTVSQYLNEFSKKNILIKINTRPVRFLHKKIFEEKYNIEIKKNILDSLEELEKLVVNEKKEKDIFSNVIGCNESLRGAIDQIKMAANYPNGGLPVLLTGPTGSGKSFLAELMYKYCKDVGILKENAPFIVLNCAEFSDNPELLGANLFGYSKGAFTGAETSKSGLVEEADEGILFLDEVHCLKPESQEKLFLLMDKGNYRRLGENDKWRNVNVRFIFATTEDIEKVLLKTFLRRIPINIAIPSLDKRTEKEKYHMILSFLQRESNRINKDIKVTKGALTILEKSKFKGNVGELKNIIKYACANAYTLSINQECIPIKIHNLPNNAFIEMNNINISVDSDYGEDNYIDVNGKASNMKYFCNGNELNELHKKVIENCINVLEGTREVEEILEVNNRLIYNYYDHLLYKKDNIVINNKNEVIFNVLEELFDYMFERRHIRVINNLLKSLIKYIIEVNKIRNYICLDSKLDSKCYKNILNYFQINYQKEYLLVEEMAKVIKDNLDYILLDIDKIIIIHNIILLNSKSDNEKILGVIISHGYATATSIADATNKMIGKYVFESIDMPIGSTTINVINKLKLYLQKMVRYENIILLVDMGSLEEIYSGLDIIENKTVGIINNITTKLALDIGLKIIQKKSMEDILKETSESIVTTYKIITPKKKKKAIITTCQTGIGTAVNFAKLIKESLPSSSDIKVKSVDFRILSIEKEENKYIKGYDVELIIGTKNPQIDGIKFIPIEKIVSGESIKDLRTYLSNVVGYEDMDEFNRKIVKRFSLENIIHQLTILNANKLIDYIEVAISELQSNIGVKLNNNTIIGLYIHLSCMIERLVMGEGIETYRSIDELSSVDKTTLKRIKKCLTVIENTFSVDIAESELGYIFDYIRYDSNYLDVYR